MMVIYILSLDTMIWKYIRMTPILILITKNSKKNTEIKEVLTVHSPKFSKKLMLEISMTTIKTLSLNMMMLAI